MRSGCFGAEVTGSSGYACDGFPWAAPPTRGPCPALGHSPRPGAALAQQSGRMGGTNEQRKVQRRVMGAPEGGEGRSHPCRSSDLQGGRGGQESSLSQPGPGPQSLPLSSCPAPGLRVLAGGRSPPGPSAERECRGAVRRGPGGPVLGPARPQEKGQVPDHSLKGQVG